MDRSGPSMCLGGLYRRKSVEENLQPVLYRPIMVEVDDEIQVAKGRSMTSVDPSVLRVSDDIIPAMPCKYRSNPDALDGTDRACNTLSFILFALDLSGWWVGEGCRVRVAMLWHTWFNANWRHTAALQLVVLLAGGAKKVSSKGNQMRDKPRGPSPLFCTTSQSHRMYTKDVDWS